MAEKGLCVIDFEETEIEAVISSVGEQERDRKDGKMKTKQ